MPVSVEIVGVTGLPEIEPGADLPGLIADAIRHQGVPIDRGSVCVVTSKIVSKAEGRLVDLNRVTPSSFARDWATAHGKDARVVEVVLSESRRIVRMDRDLLITETRHGWVCANAGVDSSNAPAGVVVTLPVDPDRSAGQLSESLSAAFGCRVAVVISDTFGRPWREGFVNVAIGVAGMPALRDYRGMRDPSGRSLAVTVIAIADEIASAAELVMGKVSRVPIAVVRGIEIGEGDGRAQDLVRAPDRDLFR
jgi:coenzyme F420-0:L-glutamate ligase/coenzyme F420-1:gamma-L-glutamate ligase